MVFPLRAAGTIPWTLKLLEFLLYEQRNACENYFLNFLSFFPLLSSVSSPVVCCASLNSETVYRPLEIRESQEIRDKRFRLPSSSLLVCIISLLAQFASFLDYILSCPM